MSAEASSIYSRPFAPGDLAACLAIFDSLTPRHFKAGERGEFEKFLAGLDDEKCRYEVIVGDDGEIVACGGLWIEADKGVASLCWDMVRPDAQGHGIGRLLVHTRFGKLKDVPQVTHVVASAGEAAAGFFRKQGFETFHVQKDYFGPGLDLFDMKLRLK